MQKVKNRQDLYKFLDDYCLQRKEELNRRSLQPGSGLLKTYVIETFAHATDEDIAPIFQEVGWAPHQIDDRLFELTQFPDESSAFLDVLTPRYLALYTTAASSVSDQVVKQAVRDSLELDHAWFSSDILNTIWQQLTRHSHRDAVLRYENEPVFERYAREVELDEADDDDEDDEAISEEDELLERRVARLEIRQRLSWLRQYLANSTIFGDLTGNLVRIRIPALNDRGRYEYYQFGKATNRGSEFIGFRAQLSFLVETVYSRLIELIEETCTFYVERQPINHEGSRYVIRGAPVTFKFKKELTEPIFNRFIELTFERGAGKFRLWGNPIRFPGPPKVHVYGLDLHLWQQIYLDMTQSRFVAILPQGTCGNTVNRLATNIQRYLDPEVEIFIGDTPYVDLLRRALRSE